MKYTFKSILCTALAATMCFGFAACGDDESEKGKTYNIVFTIATIPPVLAALESIGNGYETYALIERGNTYSGIETTEGLNFHNVGFDPSSLVALGQEQFEAMVDQIKELNISGSEKFNIYLRDADPMYGFGLAANAGLQSDQYQLILCEDGAGSYNYFSSNYVNGKTATEEADEPYEAFLANVEAAKETRDAILARTDNTLADLPQDLGYGCAAAALENVTWRLQAPAQLSSLVERTSTDEYSSKLLAALGGDEDSEYKVNISGGSISDAVNVLSAEKKTAYLSLMYGKYYEDTYSALTRQTLADGETEVSKKKLVFIGTRIKSFPALASNADYGIGGASTAADVPDSYDELADKYKTPLLFGTEADYRLFLAALADESNYETAPTEEELAAVRVQCFNYYINYMFVLKFTHATYGGDYDIIMKGHPSEVLGNSQAWGNHYEAGGYRYDTLIDNLVTEFHKNDTVGKYIGMVPYGTAAENLAYLGADIAIGGLDSSTYKGYDENVDVKFVLQVTNNNISQNTNLAERFADGTLGNHNAAGEKINTEFFNTGYLYKSLVSYYTGKGDTARAGVYSDLLSAWLTAQGGADVNEQGFVAKDA